MAKSFKGVAYWTVNSARPDWVGAAAEVLNPVVARGLALVETGKDGIGNPLLEIGIQDHRVSMVVAEGQGRGMIRPSQVAGRLAVCLVALRKQLGDIELTDELGKQSLPAIPRQSYALYAEDWRGVSDLADALGLIPGREFKERHRAILNQLL